MQDSQNISLQNLSVHIRMNLLSMTSKKLYKRVRLDLKSLISQFPNTYHILIYTILDLIDENTTPDSYISLFFSEFIDLKTNSPSFYNILGIILEDLSTNKKISSIKLCEHLINQLNLDENNQILLGLALIQTDNEDNISWLNSKLSYYSSDTFECSSETLEYFIFLKKNIDFSKILPILHNEPSIPFDDPEFKLTPLKSLQNYLNPSDFLSEIQPSQNLRKFLESFGKPTDDQLFENLLILSNDYPFLEDSLQRSLFCLFLNDCIPDISHEKRTINWNPESFCQDLLEIYPTIKLLPILKKIDSPKFWLKDQKSLAQLLKFFQKGKRIQSFLFPTSLIFGKWQYPASQIVFIQNLLLLGQPELINWNELNKRIVILEFNQTYKYSSLPPILQFWGCLEFLELMIELSDGEFLLIIRNLFEIPLSKCPDMLILGLAQIRPKQGFPLLEELLSQLFPMYLLNHSNSIPILESLWKHNEKLMIEAIHELYRRENSALNLSRVLDITQEIRDSLISLANCDKMSFSVSLGILASKREFLHFEHWLSERLKKKGGAFVEALLKYLEENLIIPLFSAEKQIPANLMETHCKSILEKSQLTLESLGIIMENLMVNLFDNFSITFQNKIKESYQNICKFFPSLAGASESAKIEVQNAVENNFTKLYEEKLKAEDLIENLTRLKIANNPFEREVYACTIHHLFDEFRYHESYSSKFLRITGTLYGELINSKLLDGTPLLGLGLGCVKFSLEKNSLKRLEFAKYALNSFKKRIFELFDFFQSLFFIENIKEKIPEILCQLYAESVRMGRNLQIRPDLLHFLLSQLHPNIPNRKIPSKVENLTLESVVKQEIDNSFVDETIRNKLIFALNTLSIDNLPDKILEISYLISSESIELWFAQTLVWKRILHETTSKNQYLPLLVGLSRKSLYSKVLKETYILINRLLAVIVNESTINQLKILLRNMGSWLGNLTLARNKPIIMRDLNVKALLLEGFSTGKLGVLLPFVCKTLEAAKQSEVFKGNNPWIRSILKLLKDIHHSDEVKKQLKIELQLLFNSLGDQIVPRPDLDNLLDFPLISIESLKNQPSSDLSIEGLQRVFELVLSDLIKPVVYRSVTTAINTSRNIVLKDFLYENDEKKFTVALSSIVQRLSTAMALANCRDPLFLSLSKGFEEELIRQEYPSNLREKLAQSLANENMDKGCIVVQKVANEKAILELKESKELINRRKTPEEELKKAIDDLPDRLKPDVNGLSNEEINIYNDFNEDNVMEEQLRIICENVLGGEEGKKIIENSRFVQNKLISPEKIINRLFSKAKNKEEIDFLIEFLNKSLSDISSKSVKRMILELPEEIINNNELFNEKKIVPLFLNKILTSNELDELFSLLIKRNPNSSIQKCVVKSLKTLAFQEHALKEACLLTLVTLGDLMQGFSAIQETVDFMESVNKHANFGRRQEDWLDFSENEEKFKKRFIKWIEIRDKKAENKIIKEFNNGNKKVLAILISVSISDALRSIEEILDLGIVDMDYTSLDCLFLLLENCIFNDLAIFNQFIDVFSAFLISSHDKYLLKFNGRPFFHLIYKIIDYLTDKPKLDLVLLSFMKTFMINISPLRCPGFSTAWLEIVSILMRNLKKSTEIQISYMIVLCEGLKTLRYFENFDDAWKTSTFQRFYKGIMRVFLVLLHDFPEFLSVFNCSFCEEIPKKAIQLKNLILAAFPKTLKLPDPFNVDENLVKEQFLKMPDLYPLNIEKTLSELSIQQDLFDYFQTKSEISFNIIVKKLLQHETSLNFQSLINSFTISIPWLIYYKRGGSKYLDDSQIIFLKLIHIENIKLKEALFNAFLNQIRFPCLLTKYFLTLSFMIFSEKGQDFGIQIFSGILIERLIVEKPHPWGLMLLVIELVRQNSEFEWKNKVFKENEILYDNVRQCIFKFTQT